ncbi:MAG: hypothetical protein NC816_01100 [Candidatus Omnitrophica bacterium]|nr:hypothetical protein [Candidatus Omnitrophota bacterium]MCM8832511.1 hypothetical protein [Candidatus Omnitrophota bacterium]
MKCKNVEKNILDFIEGKAKEKEKIKQHLEKCNKCRNLYNDFILILNNSNKITIPSFDENFWKARIRYIERKRSPSFKLKPLIVNISLLLVFLLTFLFTRTYNSNLKKSLSTAKIEIINYELPFTEDELLQNLEYINEEEVEKIIDIIFKGF